LLEFVGQMGLPNERTLYVFGDMFLDLMQRASRGEIDLRR